MKRLLGSGLRLVLALAALPAGASMILDIPPRQQWNNNHGYCGETSLSAPLPPLPPAC
jgi:hypothetical protein